MPSYGDAVGSILFTLDERSSMPYQVPMLKKRENHSTGERAGKLLPPASSLNLLRQ